MEREQWQWQWQTERGAGAEGLEGGRHAGREEGAVGDGRGERGREERAGRGVCGRGSRGGGVAEHVGEEAARDGGGVVRGAEVGLGAAVREQAVALRLGGERVGGGRARAAPQEVQHEVVRLARERVAVTHSAPGVHRENLCVTE